MRKLMCPKSGYLVLYLNELNLGSVLPKCLQPHLTKIAIWKYFIIASYKYTTVNLLFCHVFSLTLSK